eukprot:COSAG01_NODE_49657_length_370_cov_0.915129_1_plen_62_part_10
MGTLGGVFSYATVFNGDISQWDVSIVKDMGWSASSPGPPSSSCLCLPSCSALITHGHHDGVF